MHNLIICPGAQKAGTTWLYKALKAHPEFNMPTVKELTYLCDYPQKRARHIERYEKSKTSMTPEERAWWQIFLAEKSDENYRALFAEDAPSADISPRYSVLPESAGNAARAVPHAKVVIFLRDPVSRAWSHARMIKQRNPDDQRDLIDIAVSGRVQQLTDYRSFIEAWTHHFPDALILNYTSISQAPMETLNTILAMVYASLVTEDFEPLRKTANQGAPAKIPNPALLQEAYDEQCQYFESMFV